MNAPAASTLRRIFWAKVEDRGDCWVWQGLTLPNGYGRYSQILVHRLAYEDLVGPIAPGLTIDHRCHDSRVCKSGAACTHRKCVNPKHLAAVTDHENKSRNRLERMADLSAQLPGGLDDFVMSRRAEGLSWRTIATEIDRKLLTDKPLTASLLCSWYSETEASR